MAACVTPFKVVYGRDLPPLIRYEWGSTANHEVESLLLQWDAVLDERSFAYHPQTDGQAEVVNCCVETYLLCFSADKPSHWSEWVA